MIIDVLGFVGGILGCLFVLSIEQYQRFKRIRNLKKMCFYENTSAFLGITSVGTLLVGVLLM